MIDLLKAGYLKVKINEALSLKYELVQLVLIWDKWSFPIPPVHDTGFNIGIARCKPDYQYNKDNYLPMGLYQNFEIG